MQFFQKKLWNFEYLFLLKKWFFNQFWRANVMDIVSCKWKFPYWRHWNSWCWLIGKSYVMSHVDSCESALTGDHEIHGRASRSLFLEHFNWLLTKSSIRLAGCMIENCFPCKTTNKYDFTQLKLKLILKTQLLSIALVGRGYEFKNIHKWQWMILNQKTQILLKHEK